MQGGGFYIELDLATDLLSNVNTINQAVDQSWNQVLHLGDKFEENYQSPNKQNFIDAWSAYAQALKTLAEIGPRMVLGLKNEIALVQQAEEVQF